jgi:hypothetical protein
MKKVTKKFPIYAGMRFQYKNGNTDKNRIHKVGAYTIEFTYMIYPDGDEVLIGEKEIERVFF